MVVKPDTPLTQFPGVGEVRAKKLAHLGLNTAGDLLTYYPRDYEDRRQVYASARPRRGCGCACGPWWPSTPGSPASERGWIWSRCPWWTRGAPCT